MARGDIKKKVRKNEIVWLYRKGGAPQRGQDAAKQRTDKRARTCSKRER